MAVLKINPNVFYISYILRAFQTTLSLAVFGLCIEVWSQAAAAYIYQDSFPAKIPGAFICVNTPLAVVLPGFAVDYVKDYRRADADNARSPLRLKLKGVFMAQQGIWKTAGDRADEWKAFFWLCLIMAFSYVGTAGIGFYILETTKDKKEIEDTVKVELNTIYKS